MKTVSVDEIQQNPLLYLRRVEAGESFIVMQANRPIATLTPVEDFTKPTSVSAVDASSDETPPGDRTYFRETTIEQLTNGSTYTGAHKRLEEFDLAVDNAVRNHFLLDHRD